MMKKKKPLDIVRNKVRFKHYSLSTERTYVHWIKHYIFFHNKKHPIEMGRNEIELFLTYLATEMHSVSEHKYKFLSFTTPCEQVST